MEEAQKFIVEHFTSVMEGKLLLAYSGGPDSTALLHFIQDLSQRYNIPYALAHLNHNDRGAESEEDERFCRDVAQRFGVDIFVEKLPDGTKIDELTTREYRYNFFQRICEKHGFSHLLTGHTQSDDVETLLYRLVKGTGIHGLQGIPAVRKLGGTVYVLRPFLFYTKKQLLTYCWKHQLEYREDSLNATDLFLRNRIRHELLPLLKEYNPNVEKAFIRLKNIALQTESLIQDYVLPIYHQICSHDMLDLTQYHRVRPSLQQKVLHLFLTEQLGESPDYKTLEKARTCLNLSENLKTGKKYSLEQNRFLFVNNNFAQVISCSTPLREKESYSLNIPGETLCPDFNIAFNVYTYTDEIQQFPSAHAFEAYVVLPPDVSSITVRARRNGDIIRPLGMTGKMKLKKWFTNKFIPVHVRDTIPLLTFDNEVLWAVGAGLSNRVKVISRPSHQIIVNRI